MAMHNIDVDGAVQRITEKMEWVSERSKDKIPYKTVNGVHDDLSRSDINWWTNGFWSGIQWLLYHETGSQKHADIAREAERKLDRCFEEYYGIHHDAGFMWLLSAAADYRLTGDPLCMRRICSPDDSIPPEISSAHGTAQTTADGRSSTA